MSDAVQICRQQWRMACTPLCHRDALIAGPITWPAAVRMLHVGKYSVNTRVWIAVVPCGGDGVLVGNLACFASWNPGSMELSNISLFYARICVVKTASRKRPVHLREMRHWVRMTDQKSSVSVGWNPSMELWWTVQLTSVSTVTVFTVVFQMRWVALLNSVFFVVFVTGTFGVLYFGWLSRTYYWSPRVARSLLFFCNWLSLCLYARLSVTDFKLLLLFFVSWWNRAIFWPPVLHDPLYKTMFFDFWFTPQNLHKIAYKSACMAHRPQMFSPTRGFSRMADSMEPCKMLWGRPLLPWQQNLG